MVGERTVSEGPGVRWDRASRPLLKTVCQWPATDADRALVVDREAASIHSGCERIWQQADSSGLPLLHLAAVPADLR